MSEHPEGDTSSIVCTAIDNDWGDDRPNLLMHPPCACPRCGPGEAAVQDSRYWLQLFGRAQRMQVTPVDLGATGRSLLG